MKSPNILIVSTGEVKISDYWLFKMKGDKIDLEFSFKDSNENESFSADSNDEDQQKNYVKDKLYYWAAPEILDLKEPTSQSDIWSIGTIILEMLQGFPCYSTLDLSEEIIISKVKNGGNFFIA